MIWDYFTDPVLRAPTIGSALMSLTAALMGVVVFLRKASLVGESLSHCTYPGVIIGVAVAAAFVGEGSLALSVGVIMGAFLTAMLGLWSIHFLTHKMRVHSDAALCFVLAIFFGAGITGASRLQFSAPSLYRQTLSYFYGQAATMTDLHIILYGALAFLALLLLIFYYKEIKVIALNREYAQCLGINVGMIDTFLYILVALAIVIGIRSVGVVMISAMLIAPAVAARQLTHHLSKMFIIAGCIGLFSGVAGNVLSLEFSDLLAARYPDEHLSLPTGPMIVLTASFICFMALLFAPERGLISRNYRITQFRHQCLQENLLKELWHKASGGKEDLAPLAARVGISKMHLRILLWGLSRKGWVIVKEGACSLTSLGEKKAARIVRFHRLWELYLATDLGVGKEKVHANAEEMEHIITPQLEEELTLLLKNPTLDPHSQPIPQKESGG